MTTPNIIKETCEGTVCIPLRDALFQKREIYCTGEITQESASALILQLRYLQSESPSEEITLYINSPGGEVTGGLAVYDTMRAVSCPVKTVCIGMAASIAAILFCSGDQRKILPHARVMIHDPMVADGISGSALQIHNVARDMMKTRDTVGKILARHTGHTLEEVLEKTSTDCYFSAGEAVAWGLADCVIDRF